jgi:hypothetical protein
MTSEELWMSARKCCSLRRRYNSSSRYTLSSASATWEASVSITYLMSPRSSDSLATTILPSNRSRTISGTMKIAPTLV